MQLSHADIARVSAAEGWLELGDHLAANEELERVAPEARAHCDVLELRCRIFERAKRFDDMLTIARGIIAAAPGDFRGYVNSAQAMLRLGRAEDAFRLVESRMPLFREQWRFLYAASRFAAQAGRLEHAKDWLSEALEKTKSREQLRRLKLAALDQPDLEPMWKPD